MTDTNTMALARRLSALVAECVKEFPGNKRGFYTLKLAEFAAIILADRTWPTADRMFDHAFQIARKDKRIRYDHPCARWYPMEVPTCPHCKRVWPEAPQAENKAT